MNEFNEAARLPLLGKSKKNRTRQMKIRNEVLPATDPRVQYDMGISERDFLDLDKFLNENRSDPAYKVCIFTFIIRLN